MTFQCMGKYWRTFKARLRKLLAQVVEALSTPTVADVECERFRKLRRDQKLPHTLGRKGYSRTAHEMDLYCREKNSDLKGLRTRVWMHGHLRKDGTPINEAVAATLKRIEDCVQTISDTPVENSIRDDAITRVLGPGRRGRVRGLGFGVAPSKVDGQIQSNGRVRKLEEKVGALEEKNQNKNVDDMSSHAFTQSQHGSGIH
ncbi:uncharacterized protein LOC111367871 isoform X2 [Olea europaea var. sylvestris]|uniref:uncharacterized protein LOC111367871 isoform X2 n=1 Tax=Olea europaea var. sylvestris TaxID=158386 RepID=UPI000C1CD6C1|nr:uncharacterized protein LOC111367871 isoform X2 [Olea europaea var. sylvestris]